MVDSCILMLMKEVTQVLANVRNGDPNSAQRLLPLVYRELRLLAEAKLRNERSDHTLQATALVHEAYLRLVDCRSDSDAWDDRGHFFAAAAEAMRRILVESIRSKKTLKRGGGLQRIELDTIDPATARRDDKLLALDTALDRLEAIDPIKANLVKLRFFSGLTNAGAAQALGISTATADRYWAFSRVWLQTAMQV